MTEGRRISQAEFVQLLRRVGYPRELIEEIAAQLADPIDVERDSHILERYGLTREHLMDRLGASP
jgi:hypothetical protein